MMWWVLAALAWATDAEEVFRQQQAKPFEGRVAEGSPHFDLEVLYISGKFEEGIDKARALLATDPADADLYAHLGRFLFISVEHVARDDESVDKEAVYEEVIVLSEQGLAHDPDNPRLLMNLGGGYARLGTTRGVLSSLFLAKKVEAAWLGVVASDRRYAALADGQYLPCDGHYALGIFYRLVPDSWIVKAVAGTKGDLDKSLFHASKAAQCAPDVLRHTKELGVAQVCVGRKRGDPALEAIGMGTLRKARAIPAYGPIGQLDHKHIDMLLADPEMACGYSRDGQVELDEADR